MLLGLVAAESIGEGETDDSAKVHVRFLSINKRIEYFFKVFHLSIDLSNQDVRFEETLLEGLSQKLFFYFFIFAHKPLTFRKPLKNLLQKYEESF